ncbi:hypothetical protein BaRGS_00011539 [Batillaria attramentaria]|uniref:Uncharacterized protein n=1 Tax=Batillaria attramentaria TaxID=370345 RepID=A0ABD0LD54_9CAEN
MPVNTEDSACKTRVTAVSNPHKFSMASHPSRQSSPTTADHTPHCHLLQPAQLLLYERLRNRIWRDGTSRHCVTIDNLDQEEVCTDKVSSVSRTAP